MTLGKVAYMFYYKPYAIYRKLKKQGFINSFRIERERRKMERHSGKLHEILRPGRPEFMVYFLTGKKYWYQTAFCLYSLQKNLESVQIKAVFVDDGTFDEKLAGQMHRQFPGSLVKTVAEIDNVVEIKLPQAKFPILNKKRKVYPHIRKLTDIHLASSGWKMVLDSDMLFFKNPFEIEKWLIQPDIPFFLYDPVSSYYYSNRLMESITGKPITHHLNVGAVGMKSEEIDWEKLEQWISLLEEKEGGHYFLEQALSAMLVAGRSIIQANKNEYIVMPDEHEAGNPTASLHHYVAESKEWYYKESWKQVLQKNL